MFHRHALVGGFGLLLLVLLVGPTGGQDTTGNSKRIFIKFPRPKSIKILGGLQAQLASLARGGNVQADKLRGELAVLRVRLLRLKSKAFSYKGRKLTAADEGPIQAHNQQCDQAQAEVMRVVTAAQVHLQNAGLQMPALISAVAEEMVKSGKYNKLPSGATQCNIFLDNYARSLFNYQGFYNPLTRESLLANQVVDKLRQGGDAWKALDDPDPKGGGVQRRLDRSSMAKLQANLLRAQNLANQGYLVVIGWKDRGKTKPVGHVTVVVPGKVSPGGSWGGMKLPQIAQAGKSTFAGKHLGYGFNDKKHDGLYRKEVVIYVRRPGN
jgi:hypothetical protein